MPRRGSTLELAVLGLLLESPLHGYELRKRLTLILGWGRLLSYGSVYPTLRKMQRAGLVAEEQAVVGRRQRIVYALTEAGTAHFGERVADGGPASWEDDAFTLRLALFSRTDTAVRLRILQGRRTRLEERLERLRAAQGMAGDTWVAEVWDHSIDSVERELSWLGGLITAEHSGTAPPHTRPPARAVPAVDHRQEATKPSAGGHQ